MNNKFNSKRKTLKSLIIRIYKKLHTVLKSAKGNNFSNPKLKLSELNLLESPKEDYYISKAKNFFEFKNKSIDQEIFFYINKNIEINNEDDYILLAVYCNEDKLSELQRNLIKSYKLAGFKVLLIIACSDIDFYNPNINNYSDIELIRNNIGFDFGSWSNAISVFNNLSIANSISLTNDSICLVNYNIELLDLLKAKIENSSKDIIFLTENKEVFLHNQSYFFTFKKTAIKKGILKNFKYDPPNLNKIEIIKNAEIGISHFFINQGFTIDTLINLINSQEIF